MPFLSTRDLKEGTVVKKIAKRSDAETTILRRGERDLYELVNDVVKGRLE